MKPHKTRKIARVRARPRRRAARRPAGPFYADYLPYLVARASFLVLGEFHRLLARYRMPVGAWRVLATLAGGQRYTIGRLSRITLSKQPTLSRLVDRLEAGKLVRREAGEDDFRQSVVAITARGRARIRPVIATSRRHEKRLLAGYRASEVSALKKVLRRLIEAMEDGGRPVRISG